MSISSNVREHLSPHELDKLDELRERIEPVTKVQCTKFRVRVASPPL